MVLKDAGANPVNITKLINELTGLGLKTSKAFVDDTPAKILSGCSEERAKHVKIVLETNGAKVDVSQMNRQDQPPMEKINPTLFFDTYIRRFVKTIVRHGNPDKATHKE